MQTVKKYRMLISGMTGRIKRTETVIIEHIEHGVARVRKPETDNVDFILTGDLEEIKEG